MKLEMTKLELYNEVQKVYKGYLTVEKALTLFEIDNNYRPIIIEEAPQNIISQITIDTINARDNTLVTLEDMIYMKRLQESGACNMIIGEVRNIMATALLKDKAEIADIHKCYINNYTELYEPEYLI